MEGFFVMGEMPEEFKQAMERQQMEMDAVAHSIAHLWESLDKEQLQGAMYLLRILYNGGPEASRMAGYYLGVASGVRSQRFGECLGCGEDHNAELHGLTQEG